MRLLLGLLALTMVGCAQAPYTPAPKIAPLNFQPVKKGNQAIADQNKKIGQSAQKVQTELGTTRASLDAAIAAAKDQKEQNAQLDASLRSASQSLDLAMSENAQLRTYSTTQDQIISTQANSIETLQSDGEAKQKVIDAQTSELTELRKYTANYVAQEKLDQRWWGLGYFLHGIKYLGWHLLIVAVILSVVDFLLHMFVPLTVPFFQAIIRFFLSLPGKIWALIVALFALIFKPKPVPIPPAPPPHEPPSPPAAPPG